VEMAAQRRGKCCGSGAKKGGGPRVDLANGSGQSGSGLTHAGSGQKTGRAKWVAQPMTLTQSFKVRVKTGLTHIFTHEKKYI
jgi:hypothetical protein